MKLSERIWDDPPEEETQEDGHPETPPTKP